MTSRPERNKQPLTYIYIHICKDARGALEKEKAKQASKQAMSQQNEAARARSRKTCFVTIGATASFDALIEACLTPAFVKTLAAQRYTHLVIQYGKVGETILDRAVPRSVQGERCAQGVHVSGFDFKQEGLNADMRAAKGRAETGDAEGVVVSHAGQSFFSFFPIWFPPFFFYIALQMFRMKVLGFVKTATTQELVAFSMRYVSASLSLSCRTHTC